MKKLLFALFVFVFALSACAVAPSADPAQATQTPFVIVVTATQQTESATSTPPTATLEPTATPDGLACIEDPLAVTSFVDRDVAKVNDVKVEVQVRGSCPQPVFYDTTGVANGENYKLDLPTKWSAIIASVSMQIQPDGGTPTDYKGCPFIIIRGPFNGSAGVYEGAVRIVPSEWEQGLVDQVLPIHSAQCGKSITPTIISGQ